MVKVHIFQRYIGIPQIHLLRNGPERNKDTQLNLGKDSYLLTEDPFKS